MRIPSQVAVRPVGHTHFWERAAQHGVTRSTFLKSSAGTVGALAGLSLFSPGVARAKKGTSNPKPIPGGIPIAAALGLPSPPFPAVIHVFVPGALTPPNSEPSTITDFNGHIAYAVIDTAGTGTNTATGQTTRYTSEVDIRLMHGVYVGEDGAVRRGSFAFL